jgi:hypothetical protein
MENRCRCAEKGCSRARFAERDSEARKSSPDVLGLGVEIPQHRMGGRSRMDASTCRSCAGKDGLGNG